MEVDDNKINELIKENKNFHIVESEIEMVNKPLDEVLDAIKIVVEKNNKFQEIMFIQKNEDAYHLQIKTVLYSNMLKRILSVNLNNSSNQTMIQCFTKDSNSRNPAPGLSRKLVKETLKELNLEEQAKDFSRRSNKNEIQSLAGGFGKEVMSIVKLIVIIFIILILIVIIGSIF